MRLHRLALPFAAALVALMFAQPARANIMIIIDKSAQKMTVTVNGEERYTWPVSTGRSGYDTPSGEFQPFRMERDHYSREWDDAPMPNSIFFTKIGHAIHGTFEARNLGRPVSHGCVRLSTQNAATLLRAGQGRRRVQYTRQAYRRGPERRRRGRAARQRIAMERAIATMCATTLPMTMTNGRRAAQQRGYQTRGRETQYSSRSYYYRERPYYYYRPYYGRGLFFPFGR